MSIEFPNPAWTGSTTMVVKDNSGGAKNILDLNKPWSVDVTVHVDDVSNTFAGSFEFHLFVESIGPGPEVLLTSPIVRVAGPGTQDYTATFNVPGNAPVLNGPPAASSVYKLVSVIEHRNTLNQETEISGVVEGPTIYLRNP